MNSFTHADYMTLLNENMDTSKINNTRCLELKVNSTLHDSTQKDSTLIFMFHSQSMKKKKNHT